MFNLSIAVSLLIGTNFMISFSAEAKLSNQTLSKQKPQTRSAKVVFIPGYYGSFLHDAKTGEKVFLTPQEYFFPSGRLKLPCGAEARAKEELVVGGIFDALPVLGSWWKLSAYDKALAAISKESGLEILVFTYDWRLDPIQIINRLEHFWQEHSLDEERVHLVAHSYGALIAFYWLWYGSQIPSAARWNPSPSARLTSALLVTPPLKGSLAIFRNMLWGTPGTVSPRLLGPEIVSSFPAAYFLTPNEGEFFVQGQLRSLPLKQAATWKAQGWGAWQWPEQVSHECEASLTRLLTESKAFYEKLVGPPVNDSEKKPSPENLTSAQDTFSTFPSHTGLQTINTSAKNITVVIATGHETLERGFWDQPRPRFKARMDGEKNSQLFVDGDGTLSKHTQTPYPWFIQHGWIDLLQIEEKHLEALTHSEVKRVYRQWREH